MKRIIALVFAMMMVAPLAQAQEYLIKPGDVLQVEVLEDPNLRRSALVQPDGRISFPLAGTVQVAGRTVSQAQAELTASLAPNFASPPNVFVSISTVSTSAPLAATGGVFAAATIDVYVMGEVATPGKRAIKPGTTLLQFLAEMGGFTRFAATQRVQLRRTDAAGVPQVYTINYRAVERGGAMTVSTVMAPGDVIVVPTRRLFE